MKILPPALFVLAAALLVASAGCKKDNGKDTTPPVITLLGPNPGYCALDSTYHDPGATASDDTDGDITSKIVLSDLPDIHTEGTYTVRYNVSDNAGNKADEVTRTVHVMIF